MNKNVEKYFLYGFLVLAAFGLILAFTGFTFDSVSAEKTVDNKQNIETSEESFKLISSGSTDSGDVSVDLKPHKVVNGKLEVDISVNTHSVSLEGFDLKELTTLEFNGKFIKPTLAPSLTGHHNSGTLTFDVNENIDSFTIKIIGIPKVEERIFEWR
ncbi:hypothetical protein H8D36_04100 [archaeon]|nr:hypothetical protein [archaeon]MBL7056878.1 hypothetical protein [Candidatus Woesearchaeota archaeon]